ncbi:unnamed protein product [Trypanosoma congolense IL3000]|uniref:WGS project CAEQ00000000 data, annotated contig 1846 n=1 Tax=Trypanosoma congolense (strain IL3000) TaxID=1068625 RepID=F9W9B9_TRYCI|nr:unnamed protein product [Trypanosoma congolense IL3000]
MKLLEWQTKWVQSKSKGSDSEELKITGLLFRNVRKEIDRARAELEKLEKEASKAAAFAANSAGRLDEFITVFANARNKSGTGFCLGDDKPATNEELKNCFSGKDFSEESLVDISERPSVQEPNLGAAIDSIKHSAMSSYFTAGSGRGCNLIKGASSGILGNKNLEKSLWWGGGILTIRKDVDGSLGSGELPAGEIESVNGTN